MGLLDFLKSKKENPWSTKIQVNSVIRDSPDCYVDSRSISPDERPFYKPDNYYTFYSYPGTGMGQRVITFEERKRISFPSRRGLYVAEILLLEYCSQGQYPKPRNGYPGFWWFEYGIRDIGHALESLVHRGFLQWALKKNCLNSLKSDELKLILGNAGLRTEGRKAELVQRIAAELPEEKIVIPNYVPKYELTSLGNAELEENGYVPYMHRHSRRTTEGNTFGEPFNVWVINRCFPNGDAACWRQVVGKIEKQRFGMDIVNSIQKQGAKENLSKAERFEKREEIRTYLAEKQTEMQKRVQSKGDGFDEEMRGLELKKAGRDKEALVMLFISIGKRFEAPALYQQTAVLLRKYGMYEEELSVIDAGIRNSVRTEEHREELLARRNKVLELMRKPYQ